MFDFTLLFLFYSNLFVQLSFSVKNVDTLDWVVSFGKLQLIVLLSYSLILLFFYSFVYPVDKLQYHIVYPKIEQPILDVKNLIWPAKSSVYILFYTMHSIFLTV